MQFQKLVWIRVHVALKQFKVAFAESSQECPCKPRSQFLPPHSTVHGVHFCTPAKQVLLAVEFIMVFMPNITTNHAITYTYNNRQILK